MFAFGGDTIVQKFTRGYPCRFFARFARKNTTLLHPGKLLCDGDAPKCKHFWHMFSTMSYNVIACWSSQAEAFTCWHINTMADCKADVPSGYSQ